MSRIFASVIFGFFITVSPAIPAHHSVSGVFDMSHEVEWTGVITKIEWINPHTYIHLDVTDETGRTVTWRLETAPTAMLHKAGLTSEMIMGGGVTVRVTGLVARDGTKHLGFVNKITYPDGHFYRFSPSPH